MTSNVAIMAEPPVLTIAHALQSISSTIPTANQSDIINLNKSLESIKSTLISYQSLFQSQAAAVNPTDAAALPRYLQSLAHYTNSSARLALVNNLLNNSLINPALLLYHKIENDRAMRSDNNKQLQAYHSYHTTKLILYNLAEALHLQADTNDSTILSAIKNENIYNSDRNNIVNNTFPLASTGEVLCFLIEITVSNKPTTVVLYDRQYLSHCVSLAAEFLPPHSPLNSPSINQFILQLLQSNQFDRLKLYLSLMLDQEAANDENTSLQLYQYSAELTQIFASIASKLSLHSQQHLLGPQLYFHKLQSKYLATQGKAAPSLNIQMNNPYYSIIVNQALFSHSVIYYGLQRDYNIQPPLSAQHYRPLFLLQPSIPCTAAAAKNIIRSTNINQAHSIQESYHEILQRSFDNCTLLPSIQFELNEQVSSGAYVLETLIVPNISSAEEILINSILPALQQQIQFNQLYASLFQIQSSYLLPQSSLKVTHINPPQSFQLEYLVPLSSSSIHSLVLLMAPFKLLHVQINSKSASIAELSISHSIIDSILAETASVVNLFDYLNPILSRS
jgi:hypothetical protein